MLDIIFDTTGTWVVVGDQSVRIHLNTKGSMFRGAIILGIGFSLGYIKGLKDSEILADKIDEAIQVLKESMDSKEEPKGDHDADSTASEMTEEEQRQADINARAS